MCIAIYLVYLDSYILVKKGQSIGTKQKEDDKNLFIGVR